MNNTTENINIEYFQNLVKPQHLKNKVYLDDNIKNFIIDSRKTVENIINGKDHRLLCIIGPCSIHNIHEAYEYAKHLKYLQEQNDNVFIVMRTYFEKPRTTIGWKGLINDPDLDDSYDVNKGLYLARKLLLSINKLGLPCGYEVLDSITPQYIGDLISWGAIGARTTESQVHRQLVSGLSFPVGFKNGTSGNVDIALQAVVSSRFSHCFMGVSFDGKACICKTKGNKNCHIILRGGKNGPNYSKNHVKNIKSQINEFNLNNNFWVPKCIMIDCSHGNSGKDYKKQKKVLYNIIEQIKSGDNYIKGIMLESNINKGKQNLVKGCELKYGVSITDSCIDISETDMLLQYINLTLKK